MLRIDGAEVWRAELPRWHRRWVWRLTYVLAPLGERYAVTGRCWTRDGALAALTRWAAALQGRP